MVGSGSGVAARWPAPVSSRFAAARGPVSADGGCAIGATGGGNGACSTAGGGGDDEGGLLSLAAGRALGRLLPGADSMRARGIPRRVRKSWVGCEGRCADSTAGGGFERAPGASDGGRSQAWAPLLGGGGVGSPTMITGARGNAALEPLGGSLTPAGRAAGLGGGTSLRD